MQAERACRPRRGGGRQDRRRPSAARQRQAEEGGGGGGGHDRGGWSRARGGGRGRRDTRGREAAAAAAGAGAAATPPRRPPPPPPPSSDESAAAALDSYEEEKGGYSRRKVVSNWHRYEDTEKETQNDSGESQRGTDFSVLLSSAGDSFSQFRFAEEKEWIIENACPKQLSGLYVDCQSLVQALEELPLHLRLNVAAELVQDGTPFSVPQMKSKINEVTKRSGPPLKPFDSAGHLAPPNKDGCGPLSSGPFQKNPSGSHRETDSLDEDLDLLLKLDAPVNPENMFASETVPRDSADLKMLNEENELDGTEEKNVASQQQEVASKNITEEELEDWLDSMIS